MLRAQRCSRFGWRFESGSPWRGSHARLGGSGDAGKAPKFRGVVEELYDISVPATLVLVGRDRRAAAHRPSRRSAAREDLARLGIDGGVELGRLSCGTPSGHRAGSCGVPPRICAAAKGPSHEDHHRRCRGTDPGAARSHGTNHSGRGDAVGSIRRTSRLRPPNSLKPTDGRRDLRPGRREGRDRFARARHGHC